MSIITISSILITLSALFAYINIRFLKLPHTIGIMILALACSLLIIASSLFGTDTIYYARNFVEHIDFSETLMHGMLSFLLFAGALHVNLTDLKGQRWIIAMLAGGGTLISTALVGVSVYYISPLVGFEIPFLYALLFGSLISPTDPVAVMAILKKAGCPKPLETKVVGESLFNDGIAVVVFLAILGAIVDGNASASHISMLFIKEALGGGILGFVLGLIVFFMLKSINNYQVEILVTLALVMGGYELAHLLHTSGPIAMVVAGLVIGNHGRKHAMSDDTRKNLDNFWELCDEFLNAVLFLLIGLEILLLDFSTPALLMGVIMIPLLLLIRAFAVGVPIKLLQKRKTFSAGAFSILTWGGLRGGISVALVLSMPEGEIRDFLLVATYCIVLFSIIVQGLTIGSLVKKHHK
jgi:CPA1 family monovalent cation:H+ antiporter